MEPTLGSQQWFVLPDTQNHNMNGIGQCHSVNAWNSGGERLIADNVGTLYGDPAASVRTVNANMTPRSQLPRHAHEQMTPQSSGSVFTPIGTESSTSSDAMFCELEKELEQLQYLAGRIKNKLDSLDKSLKPPAHCTRSVWLKTYQKKKPTWEQVIKTFIHLHDMNS
jgi:hypothetical protein